MAQQPPESRTYTCPQCGALAGVYSCHGCGRGPIPQLQQLAEVDDALKLLEQDSKQLKRQLRDVNSQIGLLRSRRNALDTALTTMRHAAANAQTAQPVEPVPDESPVNASFEPCTHPETDDTRGAATVPETSTRSVQNILLSLGGLLSAAAIIVFTAVAWATFGSMGRVAILAAITVAIMAAPMWIMRRGLTATAETVSGLAILMIPCDVLAVYLLNLFPAAAVTEPATRDYSDSLRSALTTGIHTPSIGIGLLVVTAIALTYRLLTRMIVPGYAVAALGVVTLCLAIVQSSVTTGTALLLASAAIQAVATWLVGSRPAHRGALAGRILTQLCASIAVVSLLAAVLFGFGNYARGYTLLAFSVATALLLAALRYLRSDWRIGPLWTVRCGLIGSGAITIGLALFIVVVSLAWAMPPAPTRAIDVTIGSGIPLDWRITLTIVVLTIAAAGQLAARNRFALSIVGGVLAIMTLPQALDLSWMGGCLLLGAITIAAAATAAVLRLTEVSRGTLIGAFPVGLMAVGLSLGGPQFLVTVLIGFSLSLAIVAPVLYLRARTTEAGLVAGSALWSFLAAFPVALHLLDLAAKHLVAAGGVFAAVIALLGSFVLTRKFSANQRRFVSFAAIGLTVGIATLGIAAPVIAMSTRAPLLPTLASFVALALYALTAIYAATATRFRSTVPAGEINPDPTTQDATDTEPEISRAATAADPVDGDVLRAARRSSTAVATAALLIALGTYVGILSVADTLPGFVIVSLVAGLAARLAPEPIGYGPARGAWAIGGGASVVAGIAAVSTVPPLFGYAETVPWLDWRTPVLLGVISLASWALLPSGWRTLGAASTATLGALAVPAAWDLPWWSAPALHGALAAAYGLWAVFVPRAKTALAERRAVEAVRLRGTVALGFAGCGLAIAAFHTDAPSPSASYAATAALGFGLLAVCMLVAVLAYRRRRPVGGAAVALGLVLMPGSCVMGGLANGLPAQTIQNFAMTTACLGLLIAGILRLTANRYLPWATMVVPPVAAACARGGLPSEQSPMYIAIAGLIGVGAAMLMLPNRTAASIRTALASVAIVSTMIKVLPLSVATIALPYTWLRMVWSGAPADSVASLTPVGWAPAEVSYASGWDLAVLSVGTAAIVLAAYGLAGRRWAVTVGFAALAVTIPVVPVVFNLPWPSLPIVVLAIAIASYVLSTHLRLPNSQVGILAVIALVCTGSGLSASLATPETTLVALIAICTATLAGGVLGADRPRRCIGWLLSAASATGLVTAVALAAGLPGSRMAFGAAMVAGVFLALASARTPLTGSSTWAAEAGGHSAAIYAILVAAWVAAAGDSTVTPPAVVLVIYGALLGLLAVRAGARSEPEGLLVSKLWYAVGSVAAAFTAYWLLLAEARVSVIEVYTVPFALATLLGGWLELRRRPRLRSWTAYAPGLCLLLLPPLAQILLTENEPWRRLGLGMASIVILLLGSWRRSQAPVVVAAIMLTIQAGYEITLLWTLVPSWLPLAISGALLLTLGATFERRRRDLHRLRGALATMR